MESIQIKRVALAIVGIPVILFIFNFLLNYLMVLIYQITGMQFDFQLLVYAKTGLVIAVGLWLISIAYGWIHTGELRMLKFFSKKG